MMKSYDGNFYAKNADGNIIVVDENYVDDDFDGYVRYVLPEPQPMADSVVDISWEDIRARRDWLLQMSDFTQLPDAPLSAQIVQEWRVYRQKLRDITIDFASPQDVVFPNSP